METINQCIEEYLVNFNYFEKVMNKNGFELVPDPPFTFPSTGLFNVMYQQMEGEKKKYGMANQMGALEKEISFLNRWCVFQKTKEVKSIKIK